MKKYLRWAFFFSGFLLTTLLFANNRIVVQPNQTEFVIKLPANPTTGFQWTVAFYDKTKLKLNKSEYVASKTPLMGSGGKMIFIFGIKNRTTFRYSKIRFQYGRSWEPKSLIGREILVMGA